MGRLVIAGTNSGVGKSIIATGIMHILSVQGLKVQGFKVGPDYIDPSYHSYVTGRPSRNLDTYLLGKKGVLELYKRQAKEAQLSIIEGAMGLYDSKDGLSEAGSTAEVAKVLQAPVLLVVDCRSMARSVAALVKGFFEYDPDICLGGVILNQLGSNYHEEILRDALGQLNIPVVGAIKRDALPNLPSRYLGLVPAGEKKIKEQVFNVLAGALEKCIDFDILFRIARGAIPLDVHHNPEIFALTTKGLYRDLKIAYAKDKVFSFYYQDALDYLEHLGVSLLPFSPLCDKYLPEEIDGLIIGGGFPELFLKELSNNTTMLEDLNNYALTGKPLYAESGGSIYLSQVVFDHEKRPFYLSGLVPQVAQLSNKLQALGYYYGSLLQDTILGKTGTEVKGHQFHYYLAENKQNFSLALSLTKKGMEYKKEGFAVENIFVSFLHQHWAGERHLAQGFLDSCRKIKSYSLQSE